MSGFRSHALYLVAGFLIALPLAALVAIVFWPEPAKVVPVQDATRAPDWLKELTRVDKKLWRPWSEIVVHHSAGELGGLELIDRYHRTKRKWDSAGYDFIIGNGSFTGDGEIEVSSRWEAQADGAHCLHHNDVAIGICLVGNFDVRDEKPSPFQMLSLEQLVAYLCVRYNIPPDHVYLHHDVAGAQTRCPGQNFPLKNFLNVVEILKREYQPLARADKS